MSNYVGRRSQQWFGAEPGKRSGARVWMKNRGLPHDLFDGRPVIGILNTWSEMTPCNAHLRDLAEHVKSGVLEAGGVPYEMPVMSLGETVMRPTTMLYRNLAAMEAEELIRANPVDGVVLMAGCDKTVPSLVMGAASCNLPTIMITGGPMLSGWFRGQRLGNGTSNFRLNEELRAGTITKEAYAALESAMARSPGHCNTMGTASTMGSMVEALGLTMPQSAAIPAVDSRRAVLARVTGRRIVRLVEEDVRIGSILVREAFENAIITLAALGGSTNAVVHLLAIAGRLGVPLTPDDFDRIARDVPCLVNVMPSGEYLMEDFHRAGGLPAVMAELGGRLRTGIRTVSGQTVAQRLEGAERVGEDVIFPFGRPFKQQGGVAILKGDLAPQGAVIKPTAASERLMQHRGRAVVFDSLQEFRARIDDEDLDVDENSVLVLRNCGPRGYPGMPEVGNMSLPAKLLRKGIRDIVRITDGRMSGTAFGTVVLHVSPEGAQKGPLAALRTGDVVILDVPERRLDVDVPAEAWRARVAATEDRIAGHGGGWTSIYARHVMGAEHGADLDFLRGCRGDDVGYK